MKKVRMAVSAIVVVGFVLATGLVMAQKDQAQNQVTELNRAVIKIDSLSCGGCFTTINAGLETLEGFSGLGANLFRKLIAVDFTAPLTQEAISAKLSEVGYPGQIKSVDTISQKESFAYLESKRTGFTGNGGGCCSSGGGYASGGQGQGVLPGGGSCCALPGGNISDENTILPGESL